MVSADDLESLLGWALTPEGLCRADSCVIVPDREALERDGGIDVTVAADVLDRPSAVDEASGVATRRRDRHHRGKLRPRQNARV